MPKKIVLAYSGGLDTSVAIAWLKEAYDAEIVAFCADLGQEEDLDAVRDKALKTGASTAYVEDLREEFITAYLFPMLRANALYEGAYMLGTSIARPLIAKKQIEIAAKEHADAVAHGATGKGNDQVRFELTYYALKPDISVIAPGIRGSTAGRSPSASATRVAGSSASLPRSSSSRCTGASPRPPRRSPPRSGRSSGRSPCAWRRGRTAKPSTS
jgi:argininosuccinate synthase